MRVPQDAALLRIYLGESDRCDGRPAFEAIVAAARDERLAGATVLRGPLGFGRSSRFHTAKILRLSDDLPLVIEIVDAADRIEAFLPKLAPMVGSGLVTVEKVRVIQYGDTPDGVAR
ncbi:MAG TPA: DUF190 domain-containing protein [Candidatus Sulfotelmatobacter sp.]|jgi:PII-like signaling protein|nr:DUF190 domain-containing protein [Candidatus Sulfotelmatobacter sp.]